MLKVICSNLEIMLNVMCSDFDIMLKVLCSKFVPEKLIKLELME